MKKLLNISAKLIMAVLASALLVLTVNQAVSAQENQAQALENRTDGQWIEDNVGWWYKYPDGKYPQNKWEQINGKYYYFNEQGYLLKGWQELVGFGKEQTRSWYYFDPSNGDMKTGWQQVNGKWYYLDPTDGHMYTGLQQLSVSKFYYFDPKNGDMQTGWQYLAHKDWQGKDVYYWYYFLPEEGHRALGWHFIDNKWYHFNRGGIMSANAWQDYYYLKTNGEMAHDETLLIRGYYYTFNSDGWATKKEKAQ